MSIIQDVIDKTKFDEEVQETDKIEMIYSVEDREKMSNNS